ncbi:MAG: hypothetical protein ACFCVK_25075 [Acidimicrobiales bacterium]
MHFTIDCRTCVGQGTSSCDDCVVAFLNDREAGAVVVDAAEHAALRRLEAAGLIPSIRHRTRRVGMPARSVDAPATGAVATQLPRAG